jgi:hypothetical protein
MTIEPTHARTHTRTHARTHAPSITAYAEDGGQMRFAILENLLNFLSGPSSRQLRRRTTGVTFASGTPLRAPPNEDISETLMIVCGAAWGGSS